MSKEIAEQWLKQAADTANAKDLEGHMALISARVRLQGVPGFENLGYDDWRKQCQHEFENDLLKGVHYQGLKMRVATGKAIMFKTFETVEGNDGSINAQGIEILLEKEDDGQWRLVQERILSEEESTHDKLSPN